MKRHLFSALALFFFISSRLLPQYYNTGQDPASLKWKQVKTSHFTLIFPESFLPQAGNYAGLLEKSYSNSLKLYPEARYRIPVIVHNYSMLSNGYVSWAPSRIELYPVAGQSNLPDDPSEMLIMHEVTHAAEISSLNKGFTKALSFLLGQQSTGIATALIPPWALEGDAVFSETFFSNSGRGRSTSFMQEAKSIVMSKQGPYTFNKMLFGSFRDNTPDHYVYGYEMINYLRTKYLGFWENTVSFTGRNAYTILPVNIRLAQRLKINKNKLYLAAFDSLRTIWTEAERNIIYKNYSPLNHDKKGRFENYYSPFIVSENRIVSLKTSFSDPLHFVIIDTVKGIEKNIHTTASVYPYIFSCSGDLIVWAERHPDPRWENRDNSVIKTLNLSKGRVKQITFRTRYTAPSLSSDGTLIVAVNTKPDLSTSLVVINSHNGNLINEISAPEGVYLQLPSFTENNDGIITVSVSARGEGVLKYDLKSADWNFLINPSHRDIIDAKISDGNLYVLIEDKNSANVYWLQSDNTFQQMTFSRFGVSSFSVSEGKILFSECSKEGFNIASTSTSTKDTSSFYLSYNSLFGSEITTVTKSVIDTTPYKVNKYNTLSHLFRFHSWAPIYYDVDEVKSDPASIHPGFTILSQNNLSTLISSFGYEYSNGNNIFHSDVSWYGWYPVIRAGIKYGDSQHVIKPSDVALYPSDLSRNISITSSMYLPLSFSYSKFNQDLIPFIYTEYSNELVYNSRNKTYNKSNIIVTPRFYFSNIFDMAYRDIYPRWGQIIDIRTSVTPWDRDIFQSFISLKGILYIPGFFNNHGIRLRLGYENQYPAKVLLFSNINSFPRGYDNLIAQKFSVVSADYTMPLFYPDLSAGIFFYLKRIRCSAFYDYSKAESISDYNEEIYTPGIKRYRSYGGELLADFSVFRLPAEISAGVSAGYMPSDSRTFIKGVVSVNLYGNKLGRRR